MAKQEIKFQTDLVPVSNTGVSIGSSALNFSDAHLSGNVVIGDSLTHTDGTVIANTSTGGSGGVSDSTSIAYAIALG